MKKFHKDWLDRRTCKGRNGKPNFVENEFRQRFKLKAKDAHILFSEYIVSLCEVK